MCALTLPLQSQTDQVLSRSAVKPLLDVHKAINCFR